MTYFAKLSKDSVWNYLYMVTNMRNVLFSYMFTYDVIKRNHQIIFGYYIFVC